MSELLLEAVEKAFRDLVDSEGSDWQIAQLTLGEALRAERARPYATIKKLHNENARLVQALADLRGIINKALQPLES